MEKEEEECVRVAHHLQASERYQTGKAKYARGPVRISRVTHLHAQVMPA